MARGHPTLSDLTAQELRRLLSYDPDTGIMRWRHRTEMSVQRNAQYAGTVAGRGRPSSSGYVQIRINGRLYKRSRLAHLYMTGKWPPTQVDHINRVRTDDRWENLRPATRSENCSNTKLRKNNRSGHKGVSWNKRERKWCAQIKKDGRNKFLGNFPAPEEAAEAYRKASERYHGAFASPST